MHKTFLTSFSDKRETDGQRYGGTDRHTFTPLDKRYSPIISSICGPNNKAKHSTSTATNTMFQTPH